MAIYYPPITSKKKSQTKIFNLQRSTRIEDKTTKNNDSVEGLCIHNANTSTKL